MDAKTLFGERIPRVLEQSPDKAKELDAVYLMKISGEHGGTWTVDLKSEHPTVSEGESGDIDCVVEITDTDFEALLADSSAGMQMFMEGKIQISNPMLATKLVELLTW
jgi:putative sterol carrier protein